MRDLGDRLSSENELVTDLLTVFLGFGVIVANGTVLESSVTSDGYYEFQIGSQGYLSSKALGFALALFALHRGDIEHGWDGYLRPDARVPFQKGIRYLTKTKDALVAPGEFFDKHQRKERERERPGDDSPFNRLVKLFDVKNQGDDYLTAQTAIKLLDDSESSIVVEALSVLAELSELPDECITRLSSMDWGRNAFSRYGGSDDPEPKQQTASRII